MVGLILLLPWAALPLMTEKAALWAGGALVALIAVGAVYALRMEEMEK
jgi:NADH:ubiquinone oxidoreductase subunit 3 (subunit A)